MWANVIGQEKAKDLLKNIYACGKISHAYIFYGNEGVGKDAAAIEFAKLLNCDFPVDGSEACDNCKSCREINSLKSQLFKYIIALPSGKNESDEDTGPLEKLDKEDFLNYLSEIELKAENKYHKISLPKANDIRISSIRQIKREIYLTGKSGKKKIFIISVCDMMNIQSSNSLLKILEEPPKDSVLILTTSKINSLLPTIIGRCQKIKFNNIDRENIRKYIRERNHNITESDAEFFAELSDGSITKCNEIMDKSYFELRDKILDILTSVLTDQHLKLCNDIDFIIGKKDKERVRQFLALLAVWFRDIINTAAGNPGLIVNKDKLERITKFVSNFQSQDYKIITLIEEAILDIEKNIFLDLLLHNLSNKIKSLITKRA